MTLLTTRILPKISPTLLELAEAGNVQLAELNVRGSLNTTLLGVLSPAYTWAETPNAYNAIISDKQSDKSRMPWFAKMFTIKSLNLLNVGGKNVLTTDKDGNFLSRNQYDKTSKNFPQANVKFGYHPSNMLATIYPLESGWKSDMVANQLYISANSDSCRAFDSLLTALGHQPSIEGRLRLAQFTNVGGYGMPCPFATFESSQSIVQGSVDPFTSTNGSMTWSPSLQSRFDTEPGVKYASVFVFHDRDAIGNALITTMGGYVDGTYGMTSGWSAVIPYADDGSDTVPVVFVVGEKVFIHYAKDRRYASGTSIFDIGYNTVQGRALEAKGYVYKDFEGKDILASNIPVNGYNTRIKGSFHFLPYLAPPLNHMHMLIQSMTSVDVPVQLDKPDGSKGPEFVIKVYDVNTSVFCTKVDKSWYSEYQTSGFGLFKPRPTAVRNKNIEAFNKLDFTSLGICFDNAYSAIDPNIVSQTDLARDYARARAKACKTNDWLEQKFTDNITYGELKNRIAAQNSVSAFYCVDTASDGITFKGMKQYTGVAWKFVNDQGNVVTTKESVTSLTRTENSVVETFPSDASTAERAIAEVSAGASINMTLFADVFNLSQDERGAMANYISESDVALAYTDTNSQMGGIVLANQYFAAERSLSMNGYPIYRFLPSPYRETMVMRMYADFKQIGDGISRVINSFTSEVVAVKLLA